MSLTITETTSVNYTPCAAGTYGFLPIVREFDPTTSRPGKELYRGEFRPTVIEAACVCQPFMEPAR